VVFVVDGSPDNSFDILSEALQSFSLPAQLILHSRNFGSFAAIRSGMSHARGDNVAVMAADLQEPPELVVEFFRLLESDSADIVIGRREGRNDPTMTKVSSTMFWRIYRKYVFPDMPDGGVDIFACSREVRDVILALNESHSSLIGLLYWIGFRRVEVPYRRQERQHGVSGWSFRKKVRYLLDSVFSFTDIPLTVLIAVGAIGGIVTVVAGLVVFIAWLLGAVREPGYTPVMLVLLFSTFSLLTAHGIVGTYVWRAYENTKRRPTAIAMSRWKSDQGARETNVIV
jgi:glycosyltransferase involved in cell wall biosynthesis